MTRRITTVRFRDVPWEEVRECMCSDRIVTDIARLRRK